MSAQNALVEHQPNVTLRFEDAHLVIAQPKYAPKGERPSTARRPTVLCLSGGSTSLGTNYMGTT